MTIGSVKTQLDHARRIIGCRLRELRAKRGWTQAKLGRSLGVTQVWISKIEHGEGSLTAEQLLLLLPLFNATLDDFARRPRKQEATLQNALARLGAFHLMESSEELPSERLSRLQDAVRETLVLADSPRLIAALAPVFVRNSTKINLERLQRELAVAGYSRRLPWLVENILAAIRTRLTEDPGRSLRPAYRRAETYFSSFVDRMVAGRGARKRPLVEDVLDADVRSRETMAEVKAGASLPSRRWAILTNLQPEDFVQALRSADAAH